MRALLIILVFGTIFSANGQTEIPEYSIQNQRFLKTVQTFTDSIDLIYHKTGVLVIRFDQLITETVYPKSEIEPGVISFDLKKGKEKIDLIFEISSTSNGFYDFDPPTGYFFLNQRPYLVYTGLEKLSTPPTKAAIKRLKKRLKKFMSSGTRRGPFWKLKLTDDQIKILVRFAYFK